MRPNESEAEWYERTALEYDYEDWCRERDWRLEEESDGLCCRCNDPVIVDSDLCVLDDGSLIHRPCRAGMCDWCGDKPGDLVKFDKTWDLVCEACERRERELER